MRYGTVLVLVLAVVGCGKAKPNGGSGGGSGAGGGLALPDPNDPKFFPECNDTYELPSDATVLEQAYNTLENAPADGTTEVALTPLGCLRLKRTNKQGHYAGAEMVRRTGQYTFVLDGGSFSFEPQIKTLGKWAVDSEGTVRGAIDTNEDGFAGYQTTERFTGDRIEEIAYVAYSGNSTPTNLVVVDRLSFLRVSEDLFHMKLERLDNNLLQVAQEHDSPATQVNNFPVCSCCTMAPNTVTPCNNPGDYDAVKKALINALAKGAACMMYDAKMVGQLVALMEKIFRLGFTLTCEKGNTVAASVNLRAFAAGRIDLHVNTEMLSCSAPNDIQSSLFHEMLHTQLGSHDPYTEEIYGGGTSYTYNDRLRSCEAMCFGQGPGATKCACARCYNLKACSARCEGYKSCTIANPDGGPATMSQAVGAMCKNPAYVDDAGSPVAGQSAGTWFPSMTGCQSGCSHGAANCQSMSLSCDKNCQ